MRKVFSVILTSFILLTSINSHAQTTSTTDADKAAKKAAAKARRAKAKADKAQANATQVATSADADADKAAKKAAAKARRAQAKADKAKAAAAAETTNVTTTANQAQTTATTTTTTAKRKVRSVQQGINNTADKVVGTDSKGRTIYQGPKGGQYTLTPSGNKEYIEKAKQ